MDDMHWNIIWFGTINRRRQDERIFHQNGLMASVQDVQFGYYSPENAPNQSIRKMPVIHGVLGAPIGGDYGCLQQEDYGCNPSCWGSRLKLPYYL